MQEPLPQTTAHRLWGPTAPLGLAIALATVLIDQVHKWTMIGIVHIEKGARIALLPFLDIVYVKNTGISYSLLDQSSRTWQLLLAAFAVIASIALWLWLVRSGNRLLAGSLGLVIGGAIGNGIDRITLGGVADFFSLHAFGFYWYVFNIADIAIVAGVVGLLYEQIQASRKTTAKAR
jgi:signal peptidase II